MTYIKLIKIFFKENFSFRRILGFDYKNHKFKTISIIVLLIYGLASFLFTFGYIFFDLGKTLDQFGLIDILLAFAFIYASALSIMFVLFRANGYLFNYKDYQILEPLPISEHTVIFAKITVMLIFIYFSVFLFLIPFGFAYFYFSGFNVINFIFFLIGALTIPIIPTVIFSFISLLIARITANFRKSNILNSIILFTVFLTIMYLSLKINTFKDYNPLLNQQAFMEKIGDIYFPIRWFINSVNNHSVLDLFLLLITNFSLFFIFVYSIQSLVRKTNQKGLSKKTWKSNRAVISKKHLIITSIAAKEAKTFFNTSIYVLNVGFGPVILLVLSIASIFYANNIKSYFTADLGLDFGIETIVLIIIGFTLSMAYSTAISLSLEGKHFWILKSLPIKAKTIMYGKMLFNIYLGLPIGIISVLLFSYSFDFSLLSTIVDILFVISLSLVVTVYGSIINLFVPKFEFTNPTEVVKQSAGALFGLFGSWIILVINGLIFYFSTKTISTNLGILLMALFNFILFSVIIIFIEKKTESLFIKFEV